MTAAHCTDDASAVDVVLGAHDVTQNEATQVTIRSANLVTNDAFVNNIFRIDNDIALIELSEAAPLNGNTVSF